MACSVSMAGRWSLLVFYLSLLIHCLKGSQTPQTVDPNQGLVHYNSDLIQIRSVLLQMNTELKATMNQVQTLTDENILLKSKVTELDKKLSDSELNLKLLNASMQTVTYENHLQKSKIVELGKKLSDSDINGNLLNTSMLLMQQQVDVIGSVVFMLKFKSTWVKAVDQAILKYDDVVLNVGGGYDQNTGIFTCPKGGLYLLSVRCNADWKSNGRSITSGTIYKNNVYLTKCEADEEENSGSDFVQTVVYLNKGDQLVVKQGYSNAKEFSGGVWTFFSGVLLAPNS